MQEPDVIPHIKNVEIHYREGQVWWAINLQGYGDVHIRARDAINYEKFRMACVEQHMIVFHPLSPGKWSTQLRAAVTASKNKPKLVK
jgi:hypothetical protein